MKFGPIIVTTLAILSIGLTGCQRKSAKDAAREGNRLSFEAGQITDDLRAKHDVNVYQNGVKAQDLQAKASTKTWDSTSAEDRATIRTKLTQLIAKIDRIFQIDRRKDIRVADKTGSLKIARENAAIYLASLDKHEKALAGATTTAPVERPVEHKEDPTGDQKVETGGGNYGWGGHGTLPTLQ